MNYFLFQEKSLTLVREEPPKYNLNIDLDYPVDEEKGSAKFDKTKKTLVVTLPIRPAPQLIAERLGSNDSGIEMDTAYRTKLSDEVIMEISDNSANPSQKSDEINNDEEFRTASEDDKNVIDDFLDDKVSYAYPNYTCSVVNNVITLTLEVKNVSSDSLEKKVFSDPLAVAFKFCSIGSGYVPIYHAFALQFQDCDQQLDTDQVEVEFWDNNVVIQFPYNKQMENGYKVGPSIAGLYDTLLKLENFGMETNEEPTTQVNIE